MAPGLAAAPAAQDGPRKRQKVHSVFNYEAAKKRSQELLESRQKLPTWSAKERFLALVKQHKTLVLVGETGSGKTTQIPQFLYEGGYGKGQAGIACTQPRRVAALTVARRVAEEMGCQLGHKVGYSIRFDDCTSPSTRVKYMTDGMLLREALLDNRLSNYRVVIVDEAHERTVSTDVLLGLLKEVQKRRSDDDDFRLIIMSATLDAAKFAGYFPGAVAAFVQGRTFPVQVMYTPEPEANYLEAAMVSTLQLHVEEGPGDILVFLTGQEEIEAVERMLRERAAQLEALLEREAARQHRALGGDGDSGEASEPAGPGPGSRRLMEAQQAAHGGKGGKHAAAAAAGVQKLMVVPIFAAMPPEQQLKVFEPAPPGHRKAILATNIAETSITIAGVRYVIDCGLVKARGYNAKLGADSLTVVPVSQAQARQRSGRAGREAPGKAFRLYTEKQFSELDPVTVPEIQRSNLAGVVLQLKGLGIHDVLGFDFMDPPPRPAIIRSLELLYALGALDQGGHLTPDIGTPLSKLPVDPMFGRVLLTSGAMGCSVEALMVVAMVSSDTIFFTPRGKEAEATSARAKFLHRDGDHLTLLSVFQAFRELPPGRKQAAWASDNFVNVRSLRKAADVYSQLERMLAAQGIPLRSCGAEDLTPLRRALTAGLFPHAARRQPDGSFRVIATGQMVHLHPSSVLKGRAGLDCVVFNELVTTTKQYARDCCTIDARWLPELAPAFFAAKAAASATAVPLPGAAK